jgi:maltose O-acetyltransferase
MKEPKRMSAGHAMRRLLREPTVIFSVLNAQWHLRHAARVPLTTRVWGGVKVRGAGKVIFCDRTIVFGTTVSSEFVAHEGGCITVGDGTFINYGTSISAHSRVMIGKNCHIGQYAIINDNDYHDVMNKTTLPESRPVVLEDGVWLGARVIVLKGVRIGQDSVVGAGSVVTRDIPARSIAVGQPARVIRQF